ncbi:MAG: FecR family protein [Bacteriovorax sp.]|jgi:hypothetical protein
MKLINLLVTGLLAMSFLQTAYADEAGVAKVVVLRGQVKARLPNGTTFDVKADQSIPEGAVLQTAEKSFVKLIFIDKSQMNLGPSSEMVITSFPKKEAGIITLVKGQIRSQVTKDYMEIDDKSKSKLYIKTKTAAMGIRGTDFQVNFNAENQNTALITFEGKVAMSNIDKSAREDQFDQGKLEKVVSSEKAVMVEHGQISAVNSNVADRAMTPTLLGTKQIDALKNNETGVKESTDSDGKQYRNPLPPGVDSATFSNVAPEAAKAADSKTAGDPNGFFNAKTGEYKLPAGSIVDLNTVNVIPPPANAVFDPNTKTYVVPESYGKIDITTGEYKAPAGLSLGADGKFVMVDPSAYAKSQEVNKEEKKADGATGVAPAEGERAPASVEGEQPASSTETSPTTTTAVTTEIKMEVPKIYDAVPEMTAFTQVYATATPTTTVVMTDAQRALATERIQTTETVRETAIAPVSTTSKVNFIFNAQ